jgi:hypothetical protein
MSSAPEATRTALSSQERDRDRLGALVPDFAKLQSGGFAGQFSAGLGYSAFDDIVNLTALYGYTPGFDGRAVQSLHVTLAFRPLEANYGRLRLVPAYFGVGGLVTWGEGYFIELPERYPDDYYRATGLHYTAHLGLGVDWLPRRGDVERHGVYFELTTIDSFLSAYLKNRELVRLRDVLSSGLGYRIAF